MIDERRCGFDFVEVIWSSFFKLIFLKKLNKNLNFWLCSKIMIKKLSDLILKITYVDRFSHISLKAADPVINFLSAMFACSSHCRDCLNVYSFRGLSCDMNTGCWLVYGHSISWFVTGDEISRKYYVIVINIFLQNACNFSVFVDIGLSRMR